MSLKGQKTTAGFIEWSELTLLLLKLERDKKYQYCLLIALGSYCGLRISDILTLTWKDVVVKKEKEISVHDTILIKEKKTGKERTITLNSELKNIVKSSYIHLRSPNLKGFVFVNKNGVSVSKQGINQMLKNIKVKYDLKMNNISTHSLRKTFGRRVWEKNNHNEKSLIMLSEIFNHSTIKMTKIYLGIQYEEIANIYESL